MLMNTKTVIKCFKIGILITICILMDFKMAVIIFIVDRDSNLADKLANEKLNSEDHVISSKFLPSARALLPH